MLVPIKLVDCMLITIYSEPERFFSEHGWTSNLVCLYLAALYYAKPRRLAQCALSLSPIGLRDMHLASAVDVL